VAMTVSADLVAKLSVGIQTGLTMELYVSGVANRSKAMSKPVATLE